MKLFSKIEELIEDENLFVCVLIGMLLTISLLFEISFLIGTVSEMVHRWFHTTILCMGMPSGIVLLHHFRDCMV